MAESQDLRQTCTKGKEALTPGDFVVRMGELGLAPAVRPDGVDQGVVFVFVCIVGTLLVLLKCTII